MRPGPDPQTESPLAAWPIRASHGLCEGHAAALEAALGSLGGWSVERHTDYQGDLLLLLVPEGGDAAGPSFALHGDAAGVQVAATWGDAYDPLGAAPTLQAALRLVRRHLGHPGWREARRAA